MRTVDLPQDYKDLLHEFLVGGVDFVLIGGWAVAVHGYGRSTDDMDLLVRATPENGVRVFEALQRFGAPITAHNVTAELFSREHYGYRIGRKPLLIEVLTSVDGITFNEAVEGGVIVRVDNDEVPVIGLGALLKNKRAAGRLKDLADVEALERLKP
jgi:hypothetical protein